MTNFGGEELMALLPKTSLEAAVLVAERIRAALYRAKTNGRNRAETA